MTAMAASSPQVYLRPISVTSHEQECQYRTEL
jgi:hypothetical protein